MGGEGRTDLEAVHQRVQQYQVAQTFGKESKPATDPCSFAAPAGRGPVFPADMATPTVAAVRSATRPN